jgi:16S rRNA (guanine(527)-N(7))-methyltransferase RsmG
VARSARPASALDELGRAIEVITGRAPAADVLTRFAKYLDLLTTWNRTHHLTSYRTPHEVVRGLFIDSLLFLAALPPRPVRVIDIGAGPGIPGVPLRLVDPRIRITLVESRRKPVSFLSALKRELALDDVDVVHGRAESEDAEYKGKYDCALIRGVRLDEALRSAALGYLKPGGRLICGAAPGDRGGSKGSTDLEDSRIREIDYPALGYRRRFIVIPA